MEVEESKGDLDHLNEPFTEATALTHIAGSVSGRDLLDLRRDFSKEMQKQVKALHDVQSVLVRFEAVMESVAHGLASQRNLLEGVGLNAGHAGQAARSRKSSLDSVSEHAVRWKVKSNVSSGSSGDEVWEPSAPQAKPPLLPSMVKEESNIREARSPSSTSQNVSLSVLSQFGTGNQGTLFSVTPQAAPRGDYLSQRRSSEPCLSPNKKLFDFPVARLSQHSGHSKSSGIQSRGLVGITEEIEGITANRIMKKGGRSAGRKGSPSLSATSKKLETEQEEPPVSSPTKRHISVDVMKGFGRRMSMEELRTKYDEVLVRSSTQAKTASCDQLSEGEGPQERSLSAAARAILCCSGILDVRLGRFWQIVSCFSFAVLPLVLAILLEVETNVLGEDQYLPNTMFALSLGNVLSIGNLRWVGLGNLLGPAEHSLDDFAIESGFMQDWQRVSRKRSLEVLCLLFFMVACRVASNLCFPSDLHYGRSITGRISDILMDVVFLSVSFRCAALAFCQLHICSGLELSIDSFCLKFFKEMDIEQAIQEWNMVQANLRKVSNQCSGSFFMTAAACFASMLLLAGLVLQDPTSVQDWRQAALWLGWLYPPTLFFFYAMLRAAAVTEKAGRVGPLVNSWNLQESDDAPSVDVDRQYVVQYINQSQAGFFMKGVRITGFEVQKMMYYFAALTFTLVSRTFSR